MIVLIHALICLIRGNRIRNSIWTVLSLFFAFIPLGNLIWRDHLYLTPRFRVVSQLCVQTAPGLWSRGLRQRLDHFGGPDLALHG